MVSPCTVFFYSFLYNICVVFQAVIYCVYLANYAFLVFFHLISHGLLFVLYLVNREAVAILKKKYVIVAK